MMKQLLAATALVALGSTAFAASPETAAPASTTTSATPAISGQAFLPAATPDDHLATRLMGASVYESTAADAQSIGSINDLVIGNNGQVEAVVVGVGGFLGIGQKNVALSYPQLQWSMRNGQPVIVAAMTKDQLQNAPTFDTAAIDTSANANNSMAQAPVTTNPAMPAPGLGVPASNDSAMNTNPAPDNSAMSPQNDNANASTPVTHVSAHDLMSTTVYSTDKKDIGSVGDVILTKDGNIDAMVVDVGGFLGIGQKPVAIAFNGVDIRKDANGKLAVFTHFTKNGLDKAPTYDKDNYAAARGTMRVTNPS
jgi:sporulation protein YlmC with PRC-barrel domain